MALRRYEDIKQAITRRVVKKGRAARIGGYVLLALGFLTLLSNDVEIAAFGAVFLLVAVILVVEGAIAQVTTAASDSE